MTVQIKAYRGSVLHFIRKPSGIEDTSACEYFHDGLLLTNNGYVDAVGPYEALIRQLPENYPISHFPESLIIPGLIDTHVHYPQTEMIASYGEQLLEWLKTYTFPTEAKFSDPDYARQIADFFLSQLLQNGTTTALVFGTVHPESVDAFFSAAMKKNLRMICGKVLMDRHAPDYLIDTPDSGYKDSLQLIDRWHNNNRLHYAVTPRFAATSSDQQLKKAGQLLKVCPDLFMHTHLSENPQEVAWTEQLFPWAKNYLDIYDTYGLLSKRSVFAHGIHLCDAEYQRLAQTHSSIAHCPTSNLFLGSGLFNLNKCQEHNIPVGLGTDIGAGTSFSLLQTANEAYKVQQLQGVKLDPLNAFYLATLGGASALDLDDKIGSFTPGKEADFIVLDYHATPLLSLRLSQTDNIWEKLFALMMLGDDRAVGSVFIMGEQVK